MAEPADLDPEIAAFLRKPVDLEDLLALVARLLMDGSGGATDDHRQEQRPDANGHCGIREPRPTGEEDLHFW